MAPCWRSREQVREDQARYRGVQSRLMIMITGIVCAFFSQHRSDSTRSTTTTTTRIADTSEAQERIRLSRTRQSASFHVLSLPLFSVSVGSCSLLPNLTDGLDTPLTLTDFERLFSFRYITCCMTANITLSGSVLSSIYSSKDLAWRKSNSSSFLATGDRSRTGRWRRFGPARRIRMLGMMAKMEAQ